MLTQLRNTSVCLALLFGYGSAPFQPCATHGSMPAGHGALGAAGVDGADDGAGHHGAGHPAGHNVAGHVAGHRGAGHGAGHHVAGEHGADDGAGSHALEDHGADEHGAEDRGVGHRHAPESHEGAHCDCLSNCLTCCAPGVTVSASISAQANLDVRGLHGGRPLLAPSPDPAAYLRPFGQPPPA